MCSVFICRQIQHMLVCILYIYISITANNIETPAILINDDSDAESDKSGIISTLQSKVYNINKSILSWWEDGRSFHRVFTINI
jgi:hypothetical protein